MPQGLELRMRLVESQRQLFGLTIKELWSRYFALGGMRLAEQLEALLRGEAGPASHHEYNLIALAMNEYFAERNLDQFIPYMDLDSYLREL